MIPNINLSLLLTALRWCWRHKFLTAFVVGFVLISTVHNTESVLWIFGVGLLVFGSLPIWAGSSSTGSWLDFFKRRSADEHQRGSKIVSSRELSRRVDKN